MKLRVFTAQHRYGGSDKLDTTVKSGVIAFAPTWTIVMGHKNGKISDEQYTEVYLNMLATSMQNNPEEWVKLFRKGRVTATCYCPKGVFCHRHIFALVLERFGANLVGEVNTNTGAPIPRERYMDEVLNENVRKMIAEFQFPEKRSSTSASTSSTSSRPMIVDPLAVNSVQSQICRDCRGNRSAMARDQVTRVLSTIDLVEPGKEDVELGSKNIACCSHTRDAEGSVIYSCPIFQQLVDGYRAGVTSKGTNIDPCKHCPEHADNGGRCLGERCPDGFFSIIPGAGLVKC